MGSGAAPVHLRNRFKQIGMEDLALTISKKQKTTGTIGKQMHRLITELFPICRSITGEGVSQTLNIIKRDIPLSIHKIPTKTKVFDWEIPKEWNVRSAYIKNAKGEKIVDFADSNLHLVNYSIPVNQRVTLATLKEHLHTLPQYPDWIPYRTAYDEEDWGFCVSHTQFQNFTDDVYDVYIDSSLQNGHLTYGEYFIPGERNDEVLISTHICHPSLCNDNLSGISVAVFLAKELRRRKLNYSYRFLFIPASIGAIAWLARNEPRLKNIKHGLVAYMLGDGGDFTYKRSRRGNAEIDTAVESVLKESGEAHRIVNYSPLGHDERQFCSPGFNLPVGSLTRTTFDQSPEYHTSADNLDYVKPSALEGSLQMYQAIVNVLEANKKYQNLSPKGEPQLRRRGLYRRAGNDDDGKMFELALLWVLNLSDGTHSLLDISQKSGLGFETISKAAKMLFSQRLLAEVLEARTQ
jgi:aminopeptidase-like protein